MSFFKYNFPQTQYPINIQQDNINEFAVPITIPNLFRHVSLVTSFINDNAFYFEYYDIRDGERPDTVSYNIWGTVDYYWVLFLINDHLRLGMDPQWPLSQKKMTEKLEYEFDAKALIVPKVGDFATLPGKFTVGETIQGLTSGATGTFHSSRTDFGQVIVTDVSGVFETTGETIQGQSSGDTEITAVVSPYSAASVNYVDAAHHYIDSGNKINNNSAFIEPRDAIVGGVTPVTIREHYESINNSLKRIRVFRNNSLQRFISEYKTLMKK